jgi:hypothetical protein
VNSERQTEKSQKSILKTGNCLLMTDHLRLKQKPRVVNKKTGNKEERGTK